MKIIDTFTKQEIALNGSIEGVPNIGETLVIDDTAYIVQNKRWEKMHLPNLTVIFQVVLYVESAIEGFIQS